MAILYKLCTLPRSTFHHTVLNGDLYPMSSVLAQVAVFLSIAFFAEYCKPQDEYDWLANFLKDISSENSKMNHKHCMIQIYCLLHMSVKKPSCYTCTNGRKKKLEICKIKSLCKLQSTGPILNKLSIKRLSTIKSHH